MLADEAQRIVRLSTSDVAPAERLNYWSSILSSTLTPSSVDRADPLEFESEIAALALEQVTFTAARGSAQRSIRARPELRRTSEHCFNLVLQRTEVGCLIVRRTRLPATKPADTRHAWSLPNRFRQML
jgi:hypothetical protein